MNGCLLEQSHNAYAKFCCDLLIVQRQVVDLLNFADCIDFDDYPAAIVVRDYLLAQLVKLSFLFLLLERG